MSGTARRDPARPARLLPAQFSASASRIVSIALSTPIALRRAARWMSFMSSNISLGSVGSLTVQDIGQVFVRDLLEELAARRRRSEACRASLHPRLRPERFELRSRQSRPRTSRRPRSSPTRPRRLLPGAAEPASPTFRSSCAYPCSCAAVTSDTVSVAPAQPKRSPSGAPMRAVRDRELTSEGGRSACAQNRSLGRARGDCGAQHGDRLLLSILVLVLFAPARGRGAHVEEADRPGVV